MKEKLYTIPVNDAFSGTCECPICEMRDTLEKNAVEYTMGPSYMEDDIRMETDRMGFCMCHIKMLWKQNNRLGLALITNTHMKKVMKEIRQLSEIKKEKAGFFKKIEEDGLTAYLQKLEDTCFVCNRIENDFGRYLQTIYHLWKQDASFRETYVSGKGFCNQHYRMLLEGAKVSLKGEVQESFVKNTHQVYMENMERVLEDIEWFIKKFDYRYQDEPWKDSKDAVQRTLTKLNGILMDES